MKFDHYNLYSSRNDFKTEYLCDIYNNIDKKVGYCKYYTDDLISDIVYIEFIYINEDDRRKGYATEMVKELCKKYKLKWNYSFTKCGRLWYDGIVKKNIIKFDV